MASQKFKICPVCNEHNAPNLFECVNCGTDLTSVRPVDEETENQSNAVNTLSQIAQDMVRICDCGAENPPQARKCAECGEDISDIRPSLKKSVEAEELKVEAYDLRAIEDEYIVTINESDVIIGRSAKLAEYLKDKSYVSRQHARITIDDGKVYIENMSNTNNTFVNDTQIENGKKIPLFDGDEIGFGGKVINEKRQDKAAYFIIEGI